MLSPTLGTAPVFAALELAALLAVARIVGTANDAPERDETGGWLAGAVVLVIAAAIEWLGYGLVARYSGHDDDDDEMAVWRAERFASIAFWTAVAALTLFTLAAIGVIPLPHALTVTATFAGLLPPLWWASLPAYRTRPTPRWLHRHMPDMQVICPAAAAAAASKTQ